MILGVLLQAHAVDTPPQQQLLANGRYLAAIGNCAGCHTRDDGPPFAGGVAFKVMGGVLHDPIGVIYSTNISPDPETGIGTWTLDQFSTAMRSGVAANGEHLYPVFPYTAFSKLTHDDMTALYAYLMSVEPVAYDSPPNELPFPLSWRGGIALWKWLYADQSIMPSDSTKPASLHRGEYLVTALGHCGVCHTPRNLFLAEIPELALAGGTHFGEVTPGEQREWAAVNLTPATTGLGHWTEAEIAGYLKHGHSAKAGRFGPMDSVIVGGTEHLTEADAAAMAEYLKSLPSIDLSGEQVMSDEERKSGSALYAEYCEDCHRASGRGGFFEGPPVAGSAVAQAEAPWSLINIILYGGDVPSDAPLPYRNWEDMKAFRNILNDSEVAAIANYLRTSWNNKGGRVNPEDVARQR